MDYHILSIELEPAHVAEVSDWIMTQFETSPIELSKPGRKRVWLETYFEEEVEAQLAGGAVEQALGLTGEVRHCPSQDWASFWKTHFKTETIGERFLVVPEWEADQSHPESKERERIVINPGLSFGTGKHFTTRFCLEALEKHLEAGESVYDAGTGSGIVAVAAVALGAAKVHGVDHDELALTAARENLELNAGYKAEEHITLEVMDLTESWIDGTWDVLVANIYAHLLIEIAPKLTDAASRVLILAGIRAQEGDQVADAYHHLGWDEVARDSDHEWCGLVLKPRS